MKYTMEYTLIWHMMDVYILILELASCIFFFFWFLGNIAHSTEKIWMRILALLQNHWLAVALTSRATLHQSLKTVCLHLCMNVRSFRARLLERLWGNPVSQFWHLITIKHKEWCISADWLEWDWFQLHSAVACCAQMVCFFSGHGGVIS